MWIKRKFIAIWYLNIESVAPHDVPRYIDSFKKSISATGDNPWHELETFLEAPVLGYIIPTRKSNTKLELKEINFNLDEKFLEEGKNEAT